MQADLATNVDLSQNQDTYVTFLVRENTAPLVGDAAGVEQSNADRLSFSTARVARSLTLLCGLQQQFGIDSVADATGQDVAAGGFTSNDLPVYRQDFGKRQRREYDAGVAVSDGVCRSAISPTRISPGCSRHIGSGGFNPTITDLQFTSDAGANYTVSNVWIGDAATILPPTLTSSNT